MTSAPLTYDLPVARQMLRVKDAAQAVGVGEATVWRWIAKGFLKPQRSQPGAPRGTFVDVNEVRRVKENPPLLPPEGEER